uniref:Alternative protein PHF14 n=1 Tax=Homo sapiens TaxID=9606 RepID=L8E7B7_HUMAN|nr:alternative protein PHF14 [Homo sapiens]
METMRMMKMREAGVMKTRMMKAMMKIIVALPVKGVARRRRVKFLAETVLMMRN